MLDLRSGNGDDDHLQHPRRGDAPGERNRRPCSARRRQWRSALSSTAMSTTLSRLGAKAAMAKRPSALSTPE